MAKKSGIGLRSGIVSILLAMGAAGQAQEGQPGAPSPERCQILTSLSGTALQDPTASITEANLRAASAAAAPASGRGGPPLGPMPAHCEVLGKMQQHEGPNGQVYAIRFHMRLPQSWNGRFVFQGGGGTNGNIGQANGPLLGGQSDDALNRGYAVVSQDSGHDNAVNNDPKRQGTATFGYDDQARRNYGGASIGPVTKAAKAIIAAFYGRGPQYSYYIGGSKGGQEAFMATQRFADMFDGVLAGYPGFRLATAGAVGEMWDDQAFAAVARKIGAVDGEGLPLINKAFSDGDLALVSDAVLAACDALDGTRDGLVENFPACTDARVKPQLAKITCKGAKAADCISADQVAALRRVYGGAKDAKGKALYARWPWDAGIGGKSANGYFGGWRQWKLGRYDSAANDAANVTLAGGSVSAVFTSPPLPVAADAASLTRYAMGVDVTRNDAASKVKWGSFHESSVDFMNADSHDLTAFASHGGKLLIYHGVSDPVFSINDTITWWNAVNAFEHGKAARFVRLFAVPGMNHGGGGPSSDQIDLFTALVAWTEKGIAPDSLVGTARPGTNWPGRTRLLCPYPQQPRHIAADIESAASFHCVTP